MSNVINVRKAELKKIGYQDFTEWSKNDNHLYIGRNMTFYVPGTVKSKWHNPFKGEEACEKFEEYIRNGPLYSELEELQGKVLGCWCHPKPCHGHVLIKLLNEKINNK
jgi:hypothetical protein